MRWMKGLGQTLDGHAASVVGVGAESLALQQPHPSQSRSVLGFHIYGDGLVVSEHDGGMDRKPGFAAIRQDRATDQQERQRQFGDDGWRYG